MVIQNFGVILLFFSLLMLIMPLQVVDGMFPFIYKYIRLDPKLLSFIITVIITLILIGIAWSDYIPLFSIILFGFAGGGVYYLRSKVNHLD